MFNNIYCFYYFLIIIIIKRKKKKYSIFHFKHYIKTIQITNKKNELYKQTKI